jgi:hypothetical protein
VRQQASGVADVRAVRNVGGYGKGAAARIKELGLEAGTIGITSVNMEGWGPEYLPVNYFQDLQEALPEAEFVFLPDFSTSSDISKATKSSTATARRASWPTGRWGPWSSGPSRA